jgi:hypothetical protein
MNKLFIIAIGVLLFGVSAMAQAPSPAQMGITPTTVPEVLQVLDNTKTWVTIGSVDPTAHAFLLGKAQGGTGTATPGQVAGPGISFTGPPWPNQTINNTSPFATLSSPLDTAHGGTGTTAPGPVAGAGITITGSWPNQTISLTNPVGTKVTIIAPIDRVNAANLINGGSGCPNGSQIFNVVGGTSTSVGTVTGTVTGGVLGGTLTTTLGSYTARPSTPVTIASAAGSCGEPNVHFVTGGEVGRFLPIRVGIGGRWWRVAGGFDACVWRCGRLGWRSLCRHSASSIRWNY